MLVEDILDDIEQTLEFTGPPMPSRPRVIKMLSAELAEILGKGTWNWAMQHISPAIATQTGKRNYLLPSNFPDNFAHAAGEYADGYCCMLGNGTNESQLTYAAPELYFSRNLMGTSNGTP